MKKIVIAIMLLLLSVWTAQAKTVTFTWKNTDFATKGSDPEKSGVRIMKSTDDGVTKSVIITVPGITTETASYEELATGRFAYTATAFNQTGESAECPPVYGYIADGIPEPPSALEIIAEKLEAISTTLKGILAKMSE